MRLEDMVLISTDDHTIEPPGLFAPHTPAKFKGQEPQVITRADGADVWLYEGVEMPNLALNAVAGWPANEWGLEPSRFSELREGTYDVKSRVMDMSANGVLAALCFPSFPQFCGQVFMRSKDKELGLAMVRAYNDWHVHEWAGGAPGRLIPLGLLPLWDPQLMADEVRRLEAMGCHSVTFSENPYKLGLPSLHSDHWNPFWQACDDSGTVVCMHIGSSSSLLQTSPDSPIDVHLGLAPVNLVSCSLDLVYSPILRTFPNIKFALSEGGCGWIPFILDRIDYEYRRHSAWTHMDFGDMLPSELFKQRIISCFIDDPHGVQSRERIGVDWMTWECDYPHSDSTWPKSPEIVHAQMAGVPDDHVNKITHENAMRHWRFDPFQHRARDQSTVGALRHEAADWDISIVSRRGEGWKGRDGLTSGAIQDHWKKQQGDNVLVKGA
jgi:predicted TIM-barrel fold metal-dependent hydrolase